MASTTPTELPFVHSTSAAFDPSPLPHRRLQWKRAARAMQRIHQGFDENAALDYAAALEGDDGEHSFQAFLADPAAAALLRERPRLELRLDDFEALARLPSDSLGRAYLALAERDGILARGLIAANQAQPDARELAPDEVRVWFRARMTASHDLLHVLTGYGRDRPGELLLLAFTEALMPKTVLRVSLALGTLAVPLRHKAAFGLDLVRAYRRGRAARIPPSTVWDKLLQLPFDEARARLGIASLTRSHRGRGWREDDATGTWQRVALQDSPAS